MLKNFKHILFDNDGVNINSEDLAMRIMDDWGVEFVKAYKSEANIPADFIYRTYPGTSTDKIVEALIVKYDLPLDLIARNNNLPENTTIADAATYLADLVTIETIRRFGEELESTPNATVALEEVHALFGTANVALATTSRADRMDISLEKAVDPISRQNARLAEMFPAGANRRSGYGHPNKYDEAYGALGWNPATTIVVEDSKSGVSKAMAGRPEGTVIGTVAARFFEDKDAQAAVLLGEGAKIVISDMGDLPKAIIWLDAGMKPEDRPEFKSAIYTPADMAARPAANATPSSASAPAPGKAA